MKKVKLTIEFIPSTCWYSNVRSEVSVETWDKIRRKAYRNANYKCEICGGKGKKWPVECHEIWEFVDETHTQKLIGFIAICPDCHKVKHFGRTQIMGGGIDARDHLKAVNNWNDSTLADYLGVVSMTYNERSCYQWTLDISYIDEYIKEKNENSQRPTYKTT